MTSAYRWHQFVFGLLAFALTAPMIYLMLGLPLLMRAHGWSGTAIGLFQMAGLPAIFKVLLALPVERWHPVRHPYARWAFWLGGAYLLSILALAGADLEMPRPMLFGLILVCSVLAAWVDIPVNALAIKMLPPVERPLAGGVRSAALSMAAILGGGAMLLLEQAQGWAAPFLAMGVLLLVALGLLGTLDEEADRKQSRQGQQGPWLANSRYSGFFRQPGAWPWTTLLLGYFSFVATAWVYLKPLLADRGFPTTTVAWFAGVGGGCLGALGSLMATRLVDREALPRVLPWSALANALILGLLTAVVWLEAGHTWLLLAAGLLALTMGVSASLAFGLMMDFSRPSHRAADYGLQASLFALGRLSTPLLAGLLLDHYGHPGMLLVLALAALVMAFVSAAHRLGRE